MIEVIGCFGVVKNLNQVNILTREENSLFWLILVNHPLLAHIDNAIRARDEGISRELRDEMSAWG